MTENLRPEYPALSRTDKIANGIEKYFGVFVGATTAALLLSYVVAVAWSLLR